MAAKPEEVRGRVRLVEGDMRQFELGQSTLGFSGAADSVEDQLACLGCSRRAQEGKLILDIFNPKMEALVRQNFGTGVRMPDGRKVIRRHKVAFK